MGYWLKLKTGDGDKEIPEIIPTTSKKRAKISGIYGLYCLITHQWYVGASRDVIRRVHVHLYEMSFNTNLLATAGQILGIENFIPFLLEKVDSQIDLHERELHWQYLLDSVENGFNEQYSGNNRFWKGSRSSNGK